MLTTIHKKLVVDEHGKPTEVIIPWAEFTEIAEILGLDLDAKAVSDLEQARQDRENGNKKAYLDINSL
jgi:hypothetical protein